MRTQEVGFWRELWKNLKWMILIVTAGAALLVPYVFLLNFAIDEAGVGGAVVTLALFLILVVFGMTIGQRFTRRRLDRELERKLADVNGSRRPD